MRYAAFLNSIIIDSTRSAHTDTDYLSFGVQVGSQPIQKTTLALGDLGTGTHDVNASFVVDVDDVNDPVTITYLVVNNGHTDSATVMSSLEGGLDAIAGAAAGAGLTAFVSAAVAASGPTAAVGASLVWSPVGVGLLAAAAVLAGVAVLVALMTANCDGTVAADSIGVEAGAAYAGVMGARGDLADHTLLPRREQPSGMRRKLRLPRGAFHATCEQFGHRTIAVLAAGQLARDRRDRVGH